MSKVRYPKGWNADRVQRVLEHYESQTEDEAAAEDEAAYRASETTVLVVPLKLVPEIRVLLSKDRAVNGSPRRARSRSTGRKHAQIRVTRPKPVK